MLNKELLTANEKLANLTEDQIAAIETLSKNDEETVLHKAVGKAVGETYQNIDKDIEEHLGIKKPEGVKTYEFLKTELYPKAKKAGELESQIGTQTKKIAELEEAIKKNTGDETLKTKLKDAEDKLAAMNKQLEDGTNEWKTKYEETSKEVTTLKVNSEFSAGLSGIKFKDEKLIPKSIREIAINQAKQSVLASYDPDWIEAEDGSGKKVMVWRKKGTNEIARNKANGLNPYTASELLLEQESMKDIIDSGRTQPGTGSGKEDNKVDTSDVTVDISAARTQVQADEAIRTQLLALGYAGKKLEDEHAKLRKEHEVHKLPFK
jgi:hypothetical protein